jgi:hypothetical protein
MEQQTKSSGLRDVARDSIKGYGQETIPMPPNTGALIREDILNRAKECVLKDRQATHGSPENNFATIAGYWNNFLLSRGVKEIYITPADVGVMMALTKVARYASSPQHKDNFVDGAGYFACAAGIALQ